MLDNEYNAPLDEDLRDLRRFILETFSGNVRAYYLSLLDAACRELQSRQVSSRSDLTYVGKRTLQ
jgi:hypothetical protein